MSSILLLICTWHTEQTARGFRVESRCLVDRPWRRSGAGRVVNVIGEDKRKAGRMGGRSSIDAAGGTQSGTRQEHGRHGTSTTLAIVTGRTAVSVVGVGGAVLGTMIAGNQRLDSLDKSRQRGQQTCREEQHKRVDSSGVHPAIMDRAGPKVTSGPATHRRNALTGRRNRSTLVVTRVTRAPS